MAVHPASKSKHRPQQEFAELPVRGSESPNEGFRPRAVRSLYFGGEQEGRGLRAYTEQQVAGMLQVSRSQLRKWRMGWSRGRPEGPPFKKIGRLIRYPELGLRLYINGE